MKIRVGQEDLSSLLSRAQSVLERKTTRPILESVLLKVRTNELEVSATDLRVSLVQKTECEVEEPGSISAPGRKLHEIVRELPRGDISLEVKENQWITVAAGRSVFHLPGSPADEYPSLPEAPQNMLSFDGSLFDSMLERTLFAASNDESRLYLCGVYVQVVEGETGQRILRMVATDGHRLSLVDRPMKESPEPFERGVIVPKKGLTELRTLLDGSEERFKMAAAEGRIYASVERTQLSITLIDATFPNYQQVIPTGTGQRLKINRALLSLALKRVSLLSDQETHSVVLESDGRAVVLSSMNPQMGDAREEIELAEPGEPLKMAFNSTYFLDALRVMDGDVVEISVTDPLAPCILRTPADPGFLCVVMPMRID